MFELLEVAKAIITSTLAESTQLMVELNGVEFLERPASERLRTGTKRTQGLSAAR